MHLFTKRATNIKFGYEIEYLPFPTLSILDLLSKINFENDHPTYEVCSKSNANLEFSRITYIRI